MAKEKVETKVLDEVMKQEPMEQEHRRIPIFLAAAHRGEEPFQKVIVNGKMYLVPRGRQTLVLEEVYDVLMRSVEAEEFADEYERKMAEPLGNPALR